MLAHSQVCCTKTSSNGQQHRSVPLYWEYTQGMSFLDGMCPCYKLHLHSKCHLSIYVALHSKVMIRINEKQELDVASHRENSIQAKHHMVLHKVPFLYTDDSGKCPL